MPNPLNDLHYRYKTFGDIFVIWVSSDGYLKRTTINGFAFDKLTYELLRTGSKKLALLNLTNENKAVRAVSEIILQIKKEEKTGALQYSNHTNGCNSLIRKQVRLRKFLCQEAKDQLDTLFGNFRWYWNLST